MRRDRCRDGHDCPRAKIRSASAKSADNISTPPANAKASHPAAPCPQRPIRRPVQTIQVARDGSTATQWRFPHAVESGLGLACVHTATLLRAPSRTCHGAQGRSLLSQSTQHWARVSLSTTCEVPASSAETLDSASPATSRASTAMPTRAAPSSNEMVGGDAGIFVHSMRAADANGASAARMPPVTPVAELGVMTRIRLRTRHEPRAAGE
jgi:hypothetical protein